MKLNPPSAVRTVMYAFMIFINAFMAVIVSSDVKVPIVFIALLAGYNAVMGVMAGVNVTPDER
jgi:hypothetical protein